jgi:hypothetical protein
VNSPGEYVKAIVAYTTDEGNVLTIVQTQSIANLVNNPVVPIAGNQGVPERWRLRHIYIGTVFGGTYYRRKIVIASPNNPYFVGLFSYLVIDGVQWLITDRKGESRRGPYLTH